MRKLFATLFAPALVAAAAMVTTTAPAKADLVINGLFPFIHITPDQPPAYYYGPRFAPNCYWDAYYGRVCY